MNRDEIMNMSNEELNDAVAEKVMGWHVGDSWGGLYWVDNDKCSRYEIVNFKPSQYINIAWEVVEKLRPTHIYELADFGRNKYKNHQHYAAFHPLNEPRDYERQVHAKTLTEAICKAALLSLIQEDTP